MDYTKINSVLSNLDIWTLERKFTVVGKEYDPNYGEELDQGERSEKTLVFDIKDDEYFLKVTISCNSYGDDERISSIAFVKPVKKEVVVYE